MVDKCEELRSSPAIPGIASAVLYGRLRLEHRLRASHELEEEIENRSRRIVILLERNKEGGDEKPLTAIHCIRIDS